jgi:hypothetical protein
MTLEEAITKAKDNSRNGYVQHVCKMNPESAKYRGVEAGREDYVVSDWYDGTTVVSFENGRQL